MAGLVTGSHFPPIRLDVIKHLPTPDAAFHEGCGDPDCLIAGCQGNHLEVVPAAEDDGDDDSEARRAASPRWVPARKGCTSPPSPDSVAAAVPMSEHIDSPSDPTPLHPF